ncbi:NADH-FMN oxidoreductase RutF, flavin reductase (DIM6/NTAB) family [Saccharopolyspora antimicrobica]|uniref:Flavin reductase (DIM6/NTAB) family NADH-FMN oxidoreductase RutF n=1 Tax=Saccharopolyspora antimicrobica TaxID=455193 RepID=A0A1I5C597_9PSEU|nr:flavin reductase family protein [Saccharopolyspora antimicrobica]RKT88975.1 flavin reductase (DIM6/NTAB) family NADH-FMN oxidoreductase RutF [Saccharopolyspora antimicrobica]SFN81821.1 NADH-FMN oxidoreductase RutF, flavin reductase (DIM6/NTAB) family [Saccharopolyspora antimicrobica]
MPDPMTGTVRRAPVDAAQFRSLMTTHPAGVAVVTTAGPDGEPWGMTCSSVCSVSLLPPTLLVCLRTGSPTLASLLQRSAFAVNLLHEGAESTATLFASGAPDRFDRVDWVREPGTGVPQLVEDAHTVANCQVGETLPVGDHIVVFGEVVDVTTHATLPPRPLLYGMRRYWSLNDVPTPRGPGTSG